MSRPVRASLLSRLPGFLAYPLQSPTIWMIVGLAVVRLLNHLPSVLGALVNLFFWVMAFKLAVEALTNTMQGRYAPVSTGDVMATDGEALDQLKLQAVFGLAALGASYFLGLPGFLAVLALWVLVQPAAVVMLAVDGSVLHALNPLSWLELMRRLGGAYFGVVALVAALSFASGLIEVLLEGALPYGMGQLPASLVAVYSLVVVYHVLGDVLHRHHEQLGLDVAPAIAPTRYANPVEDDAVAAADALAAQGRPAEGADRLQDLFRGRGASDAVHERYRELVIAAGDVPRLLRHDAEFVNALVVTGNEKRALAIAVDAGARDAAFRVPTDESTARLVAFALRSGRTQLAVSLAADFEERFPASEFLPQVLLDIAWPMADKLGLDAEARRRLRAAQVTHARHALAPALREQLERIDRLPTA